MSNARIELVEFPKPVNVEHKMRKRNETSQTYISGEETQPLGQVFRSRCSFWGENILYVLRPQEGVLHRLKAWKVFLTRLITHYLLHCIYRCNIKCINLSNSV